MPRKRQPKDPFKVPIPIEVHEDGQEQPVKIYLLDGGWTDVVVFPVQDEMWEFGGRLQASKTWYQVQFATGRMVIFKNLHTGQWWHARDEKTRPPGWPLPS